MSFQNDPPGASGSDGAPLLKSSAEMVGVLQGSLHYQSPVIIIMTVVIQEVKVQLAHVVVVVVVVVQSL